MLARMSPELSSIPNVAPAPYAAAMLAFGTGLAYLALLWASTYWHGMVACRARAASRAAGGGRPLARSDYAMALIGAPASPPR
jgi:hypothetical protein